MEAAKRPNLFLIGAPKCGTTSLHDALARHPRITMSAVKEPCRFTDFAERSWHGPLAEKFRSALVMDPAGYDALFASPASASATAPASALYRGESSTDYLSNPRAVDNIRAGCGDDVRIIAVVRNPVRRAFSEHMHLVREGVEPAGFLESLDREAARMDAGWVPLFHHTRRGLYAERLTAYREVFGDGRLLVLTFQEVVRDFPRAWDRILAFLDLEPAPAPDLQQLNRSGRPRSARINAILRSDNVLRDMARSVVPLCLRSRLRGVLDRANLERVTLTDEMFRGAAPRFAADDALMRERFGFAPLELEL